MKKTYISPAALTVQLGYRDALLQSVSSSSPTKGLTGTSFGGTTSSTSGGVTVTSGDTKESKNIWDEEW